MPLDTIIIILLIFIFLYGLYKGLISLSVPIIAIIATLIIAPLIYNFASKTFNHSLILKIISFILTYSAIRIILSKAEDGLKKLLKIIFLGWADRLLGAAVLIFLTCVIISIASAIIITYIPEYSYIITNSKILILIYDILGSKNYIDSLLLI